MTQEEARLTLQDSLGYLSQEHPRILEALRVAIKALSQPTLPSNLDEAAHSYAWEKQEHHIDFDGDEYLDYGPRYDAFKAGAEWMAGQGVTVGGKVIMDFSEPTDIINRRLIAKLGDALLKIEPGEVIVQIRKK